MTRILIIDDDEMVCKSLEMLVRAHGWQAELADGGTDGLAKARQHVPDLIVCDLNMRGMSGLETLAEFRGDPLLRSVPVFVMTGSEGEEAERKLLELGAQAVLLKPFNSNQFVQLVQSHLHLPENSE